ncbi:MAG: L,D-transpeptidase [Chloroflexi bacterium]|nr:L,D-transpeptidase [Chloroflexota bacterium]
MNDVSRREFLRRMGMAMGGIGAAAMARPVFAEGEVPADDTVPPAPAPTVTHWFGQPLGRILLNVMTIYSEPSWKADHVGFFYWNDVVPILGAVVGEGLYHTNHTWLQVEGGYIYSSWVQPVISIFNAPAEIPEGMMWSEVTVPISLARSYPEEDSPVREPVYYSQVQRVSGLENGFYKVEEIYGNTFYLKADHVRLISPEEVAPISAEVDPAAKRIEISIGEQVLYAFEGEAVVYTARISTGMPSTPTSFGTFNVLDKRHGQRMVGGRTGGGYNLAGIPWVSYFTYSHVALHGCYWHNDYGRLHSNGCINMWPHDVKWIFRWVTPQANYWDFKTLPNEEVGQPGTTVIVRW